MFNKAKKVCQQIISFIDVDSETLSTFICHEKGTYFKWQLDLLKKKYSKQYSYKLSDIFIGDMKIWHPFTVSVNDCDNAQ